MIETRAGFRNEDQALYRQREHVGFIRGGRFFPKCAVLERGEVAEILGILDARNEGGSRGQA